MPRSVLISKVKELVCYPRFAFFEDFIHGGKRIYWLNQCHLLLAWTLWNGSGPISTVDKHERCFDINSIGTLDFSIRQKRLS